MSKVREKLLEQFQKLDESLLFSEFTFGFELEALVSKDSEMYDLITENGDVDDDDTMLDNAKHELDNLFGVSGSRDKNIGGSTHIHTDSSVHPEDNYSDVSIEYSSAIYPCTPKYFSLIMKGLKEALNMGVYTNNTCGFHHHIHFRGMTERDMVWIYCNMASDPEFIEKFKTLDVGDGEHYDLYSTQWAKLSNLKELKASIDGQSWDDVLGGLNTRKWRAFRIHPQGTLEWRGPRDFMDDRNLDNINKFYRLFHELIKYIIKYMDSKTLVGNPTITKKMLFDGLTKAVENTSDKPDLEFIKHNEPYDSSTKLKLKMDKRDPTKISDESKKKLISKIDSNPKLLYNILSNENTTKILVSCLKNMYGHTMLDKFHLWLKPDFIKNPKFAKIKDNIFRFVYDTMRGHGFDRDSILRNLTSLGLDHLIGNKEYRYMMKKARNINDIVTAIIHIARGHGRLTLKSIEEGITSMIKYGSYVSPEEFFGEFMTQKMKSLFGPVNSVKLSLWYIKEYVKNHSFESRVGSKIKEFIDFVKTDEEAKNIWDSGIKRIAANNNYKVYGLVIDRPTGRDLVKLISRHPEMINSLTDEEKNYLESIGL